MRGQGFGAPRMAQPAVLDLLERTVGFRPVPGTLNLVLPHPFDPDLSTTLYVPAIDLSPTWEAEVGQAGYWLTPVLVADRYPAVAVQADEPGYPPEQVELICAVRLRDALGLADGDAVTILVGSGVAEVTTPEGLRPPQPVPGERWIVGAVIHNGKGRIFVQRRSADRGLFPGAWDLVGGHLEPGEQILDCLVREVREETGWRVTRVVAELGTMAWTGDDGLDRSEVDYLVEVGGDLAHPVVEADRHLDPRWVTREEALGLLDGSHASDELVRPIVERAFAILGKT
jgi:8-oxo-dGTP diphosphatase